MEDVGTAEAKEQCLIDINIEPLKLDQQDEIVQPVIGWLKGKPPQRRSSERIYQPQGSYGSTRTPLCSSEEYYTEHYVGTGAYNPHLDCVATKLDTTCPRRVT